VDMAPTRRSRTRSSRRFFSGCSCDTTRTRGRQPTRWSASAAVQRVRTSGMSAGRTAACRRSYAPTGASTPYSSYRLHEKLVLCQLPTSEGR
jgi:hypothetical protein